MITFLVIVHLVVAVLVIFLVLIQDSKGGSTGGVLGSGGANSLLGATSATSFVVKLTRAVAIIFAVTCVLLTVFSNRGARSVMDDYNPAAETAPPSKSPAVPAQPGAPTTAPAPVAPAQPSPEKK